jgi:hypothetical protein
MADSKSASPDAAVRRPDAKEPDPDPDPKPDGNAQCMQTPDSFGITQLYCTKIGGDQWAIDMANPKVNLARFNPQTSITKNADGSWKVTSTQVRMNVYTMAGFNPGLISTLDQTQLGAKGYMQSAADWKNVEITGYVRVNKKGDGDDNLGWYGRGGRHTDDRECEGTAYKAKLFYSGKTQIGKEQWHPNGESPTTLKAAAAGSIVGKWVGFKTVMFNVTNGVKIELYADWSATNTWTKIDERLDTTGWGDQGALCKGAKDAQISWGGPIVTFSWDTATDVDFKNLSVREIEPPKQP